MNSDQKIGTQLGKALKRKDFTSQVSRQAFESGFFQSNNLPRTSVRINLVLSRVEFKYYRFACCHVPKNLFAQYCQISDTIFFERLKLVQKNLASSKLFISQVLVLSLFKERMQIVRSTLYIISRSNSVTNCQAVIE